MNTYNAWQREETSGGEVTARSLLRFLTARRVAQFLLSRRTYTLMYMYIKESKKKGSAGGGSGSREPVRTKSVSVTTGGAGRDSVEWTDIRTTAWVESGQVLV